MSKKQAIQELLNRKTENTEIQIYRKTDIQEISNKAQTANKKKATFDLSFDLHTELKVFAAKQNKKMVEVVEEALKRYFDSQ